jgi:hypothetical protein
MQRAALPCDGPEVGPTLPAILIVSAKELIWRGATQERPALAADHRSDTGRVEASRGQHSRQFCGLPRGSDIPAIKASALCAGDDEIDVPAAALAADEPLLARPITACRRSGR